MTIQRDICAIKRTAKTPATAAALILGTLLLTRP